MITKIFFTMLVIIVVGMIFRSQNQGKTAATSAPQTREDSADKSASLAPKTVAYLLIALLIIVSGMVAYFSWSDANQVVTLRVVNASGALSEYQAYRKNISGREFTSIEGIYIRLADTDRLEMLSRN